MIDASTPKPATFLVSLRRLPAGWMFTVLAFLIWLLVHGDYGITWDETVQSRYGEALLTFFSGGQSFADFSHSPNLPENIYFYGPLLDLSCASIAHLFGADIFAVRHGVQGLMWVAMFYPVCALGRRLAGRPGAWFAGCALLGTPGLLGQAFNNPKDIPLACATIWLVYAVVAVSAVRRLGWKHALQLGFAAGFVLAMRPGAWFLCVLVGLVPLAAIWREHRQTHRWQPKAFLRPVPWLLGAGVIGWLLMILPWPNAWHSPIGHPVQSAHLAMRFQEIYPVLLNGIVYPSIHLPWNYLGTYLIVTEPLPILILAVIAHLVLWKRFFRSIPAAMAGLGIAFLLWFPLITFLILRPNIYDGLRHFLFMLPAVAVLAGAGMGCLLQYLHGSARRLVLLGGMALLLSAVPEMARLHPYQNIYYNVLAGAKNTLHQRYETDYWVSSYREAAGWINGVQASSGRPLCVAVSANNFSDVAFTHFLDPRVKAIDFAIDDFSTNQLPSVIDYYVATVRYNQWNNFATMPVAHQIEREGTLLCVIRGNVGK